MAVTAVYAQISRVLAGGGVDDSHVESNISATTASFRLRGGLYAFLVVGATFGTVTLQVLGPDGSTWLTAFTALSASGTTSGYLPVGEYRIALA